jgi:hypothetical protein
MVLGVGLRISLGQTGPAMPGMDMSGMGAKPVATASAPAGVEVALSSTVEEGKKQLIATVKKDGKLLEGATVSFGAKRTFGRLVLGSDKTLDDGTAAVLFPTDLPGGPKGELELDAVVTAPLSLSGARTELTMTGGTIKETASEPFPRALWAPSAPVALIAVIAALLAGAWGSYLFVVMQLVAIRRGASI